MLSEQELLTYGSLSMVEPDTPSEATLSEQANLGDDELVELRS